MSADEQLPLPLGGEPAAPRDEEDGAWRLVLARWTDDGAHRDYLARFTDLEALAVPGRRYREALEERPGDPVAARWRDEVLRRATAQGLAALPRAAPRRSRRPSPRALAIAVLAVALAGLVGFAVFQGARLAGELRAVFGR